MNWKWTQKISRYGFKLVGSNAGYKNVVSSWTTFSVYRFIEDVKNGFQ